MIKLPQAQGLNEIGTWHLLSEGGLGRNRGVYEKIWGHEGGLQKI